MPELVRVLMLLLCVSFGQTHDPLIADFIESLHTTTLSPRSCGVQKQCVPFYRCKAFNSETSMCGYPDTCCNVADKLPLTTGAESQAQHGRCGYRNVGAKATASTDNSRDFGEFPWYASLMITKEADPEIICSAAIIAPTAVLTNAECAESAPQEFYARAGEWLGIENKYIQYRARRVKKVIVHERYDGDFFSYNIALLIVESPFYWEEKVRPVCLPAPNMSFDEARCYFADWIKANPRKSGSQAILKRVNAPIVPLDQCQAQHQRYANDTFIIEHTEICAGGKKDKGYDVFDNGAPLVCPVQGDEERYFVVGILSRYLQRKDVRNRTYVPPKIPRVYTSVPLLLEWVHDKHGIDLYYL